MSPLTTQLMWTTRKFPTSNLSKSETPGTWSSRSMPSQEPSKETSYLKRLTPVSLWVTLSSPTTNFQSVRRPKSCMSQPLLSLTNRFWDFMATSKRALSNPALKITELESLLYTTSSRIDQLWLLSPRWSTVELHKVLSSIDNLWSNKMAPVCHLTQPISE